MWATVYDLTCSADSLEQNKVPCLKDGKGGAKRKPPCFLPASNTGARQKMVSEDKISLTKV